MQYEKHKQMSFDTSTWDSAKKYNLTTKTASFSHENCLIKKVTLLICKQIIHELLYINSHIVYTDSTHQENKINQLGSLWEREIYINQKSILMAKKL